MIKPVIWQLGASGTGIALTIALNLSLARLLSTDEFALYGLALAVQHFAMALQDGGFRTLLVREKVRATVALPFSGEEILARALGHTIATTLIFAIMSAGGLWYSSAFAWLLALAVLGGAAKILTTFVTGVLFSEGRYLLEARLQVFGRAIVLVAGLTAALTAPSTEWVLAALLIGQCVTLPRVLHGVTFPRPRFSFNLLLLRTLLPFFTLSMLTILYFRVGPFFLFWLQTDLTNLAHFALGHRLMDAVISVLTPLAQMFFVFVRKNPRYESNAFSWPLTLAWLISTAIIAYLVSLTGEPMAVFLAGEKYRGVGNLLPLFVIALMFALPNFLLMQVHMAENRERIVVRGAVIAMVVGLGGNAVLDATFGALGATIALILSEFALGVVLLTSIRGSRRPQFEKANDS